MARSAGFVARTAAQESLHGAVFEAVEADHSQAATRAQQSFSGAQPGIKLDVVNIDGDTALMTAAEQGHAEIVELLLKAGASVSIIDKRGETATSLAQKSLAKQQAIVEKQQAMLSKLQSRPQ